MGAIVPSDTPRTAAATCNAPEAPKASPSMDLIAVTGKSVSAAPNRSLSAPASTASMDEEFAEALTSTQMLDGLLGVQKEEEPLGRSVAQECPRNDRFRDVRRSGRNIPEAATTHCSEHSGSEIGIFIHA